MYDFPDRLSQFSPYFTLTTNNNVVGPFINRSPAGYFSPGLCLAECFFTSSEDCHFAYVSSYSCSIGTFKLWPNTYYPTYSYETTYINTGKSVQLLKITTPTRSCGSAE